MTKQTTLKLVHSAAALSSRVSAATRGQSVDLLRRVLSEGVLQGDAEQLLDQLPRESVYFSSRARRTLMRAPTAVSTPIAMSSGFCLSPAACTRQRNPTAI